MGTDIKKSNKEKKKIGWIELFRELSKRLKQEIFLLAFLFGLLATLVAISTPYYSIWVAVTFIALYFIAVGFYFALKTKKTSVELQEKSEEYINYKVGYPSAFQNPYIVAKEKPSLRTVHFNISFDVTNHSKGPLLANVYLKSPTQAVVFVWDSPRKVWHRRFGIIPYQEEFEFALDDLQTRSIDPDQKETFNFHGWYRPHFAFKDFDFRSKVVITFRIYAKSEENFLHRTYFDTRDKKIEIPFRDRVRYVKKTRMLNHSTP